MNKKTIDTKNVKKGGRKLLGGALVGAILGVIAGILLAPESGEKMQKDIKKLSGDFYSYIAPEIKKLKEMSDVKYNAFMTEGAKRYAKIKQLSIAEEKILMKIAKSSWQHIKKHMA